MSDKTSLGDRMKTYEEAVGTTLLRRTPVIIRVDGKAFHSFTKKITKEVEPDTETHFSKKFHGVMMSVAASMLDNTQNSMIAYTQSDEISILLNDWTTLESQQWFDGKVQKIVSISAAMAATYFNHFFNTEFGIDFSRCPTEWRKLALFDARAFNVPHADVANYFVWRQRDAIRNSVNFIARKFFSHKSLQNLNGLQIKHELHIQKGVIWENYPLWEQRGSAVYRNLNKDKHNSSNYISDDNIPEFTENREFIKQFLKEKEE